MSKKVYNLDNVIENAKVVKLGDECPFCTGDKKFINKEGKDFTEHFVTKHRSDFTKLIKQQREKDNGRIKSRPRKG